MECCWVGKVVNQTLLSTLSTFFSGEVRRTSQKKKNREKNYCCWCAARNSGSEAVKKSGVLTFRASHSQSFALLAGIFFFSSMIYFWLARMPHREVGTAQSVHSTNSNYNQLQSLSTVLNELYWIEHVLFSFLTQASHSFLTVYATVWKTRQA